MSTRNYAADGSLSALARVQVSPEPAVGGEERSTGTSPPRLDVVLVESEPLARGLISRLLGRLPEVHVLAVCSDGYEAIGIIRKLQPDLLILKIEMPGLTGFDVLEALQPDTVTNVVFTSAFEDYAVHAFDLHAVDYLLQPVDEALVRRALKRAAGRVWANSCAADGRPSTVSAAVDRSERTDGRAGLEPGRATPARLQPQDQRLAVKSGRETVLVEFADIAWIDAAGDYMCLHVNGETLVHRSTLKALMARLEAARFRRVHRSTVVNLDRIVKVTSLKRGEYLLDMGHDSRIKVSRYYRGAIKAFLEGS